MICTVQSEPQMKAVTNAVQDGMKSVGVAPLCVEGDASSGWVLMAYSTIILHIFRADARTHYDLDGFWGDAPKIELDAESAG
jgi:ribosome-associated protein